MVNLGGDVIDFDKVKIAAEEKEKLGSLGRADGQEIKQIKPLNRGYHPV